MKEKLTPAPLNQKDIVEDFLFEALFDYSPGYIEDNKCVMGFINSHPVSLVWSFGSHTIRIYPNGNVDNVEEAKQSIISKLDEMNREPDCQTICKISQDEVSVYASFYYKSEE